MTENSSDGFVSSAEMISRVFENLDNFNTKKNTEILSAWEKTVKKISEHGQNLYDHSRVIDLKNEILLIETDHSAWSQMLQLNKKFILTGLERLCKSVKISSLAFRVRGSDALLSSSRKKQNDLEKERFAERMKKFEEEEKALEKLGFSGKAAGTPSDGEKRVSSKEGLPKELKDVFKRMRNSINDN